MNRQFNFSKQPAVSSRVTGGRSLVAASFGTGWVRPSLHPEPSDIVLVSEQRYAVDGGTSSSIDPQGTVTSEQRDQAGRRIQLTENAAGETSQQRVSQFQYAPDGGLKRLILVNPTTGEQVTTWDYGTTLATSGVARSDLPVSKTYPTGESESQNYNRQGEVRLMTDPNGSVHGYRRDKLGKLTDDQITALASEVDDLVRRISTTYDERGRVQFITSGSDPEPGAGTVINQTAYSYNGIDCLTKEAQSDLGVVDGSTPSVQYNCTGALDNVLRRTALVYPSGRTVNYEYGAAGSIDDVLNRVQSVHDDDLTVLAEFQYLGSAMPAVTSLPQPAIQRRWKKLPGQPDGDAGDPYTGYDRFGRTEQMQWWTTGGSPASLVNVQWGYNRASQKKGRKDLLAPASTGQDQHFGYDGLYQVTERQRGLLNTNTTAVGGIPAQVENFSYDETGNWITYRQSNEGALSIDQSRVNNRSNQVTQVDGSSAGISYDANGNMLTVPTGDGHTGPSRKLVWDAWNRLRKVSDEEENVIAEYQYDGNTRRTKVESDGVTKHCYYDDQWRTAEERLDASTTPVTQHVWHPSDRWELLFRDRSTANNGTLDERLYSLKDQLDPVAICDTSGSVVERFSYSAFGLPTFLNSAFIPQPSSLVDWSFLFHAEFADAETGWFNYGYRYYVPTLGRWTAKDPIEEEGGLNLYAMVRNKPVNQVDRLGLECGPAGYAMIVDDSEKGPRKSKAETTLFYQMAGGGSFPKNRVRQGNSGKDLFDFLEQLTQDCCCIKDLRLAGHAGSRGLGGTGPGRTGFYSDFSLFDKKEKSEMTDDARDFEGLEVKVRSGKIQFCPQCVIKFHGCAVGDQTIRALASATGCRVIAGPEKCAPYAADARKGVDSPDSRWRNDGGWRESDGGAPVEQLPGGKLLDPNTGTIRP